MRAALLLLLLLLLMGSWRLAPRMCHAVKSNPMGRDSRLAGSARQDCTQLSTIPRQSAGLASCFSDTAAETIK
jgi:hypothetical protein